MKVWVGFEEFTLANATLILSSTSHVEKFELHLEFED